MYHKYLIAVFCFFLCFAAYAGTFDLVNDLLYLDYPDSSMSDVSRLDLGMTHHEVLRSSRNDTLLSRYTLENPFMRLHYAGINYNFAASWNRHLYDVDDLLKTDYTYSTFKPVTNTFTLEATMRFQQWMIHPSIAYTVAAIQDTLFVTDYPTSETAALNHYFFDLLPETFGDTIHFNNRYNDLNIGLSVHRQPFYLQLSYMHKGNQLTERHINSSLNEKLNGPRESLFKTNNYRIHVLFGLDLNKDMIIWSSITYGNSLLDWHHTLFPSENDIALDVSQLAGGDLQSFLGQIGYNTHIGQLNIHGTLMGGTLAGSDTLSTPVLGYFLRFFPISHQGDVTGRFSTILGHIHMDHPLRINRAQLTPRLDILMSRIWSALSFNALLEFGLEDIQFEETYIHEIYLASLGLEASIPIGDMLNFNIEAEQLVPYIRTVSPIQPQPEPSGIKRYGGLSVNAGLSISW